MKKTLNLSPQTKPKPAATATSSTVSSQSTANRMVPAKPATSNIKVPGSKKQESQPTVRPPTKPPVTAPVKPPTKPPVKPPQKVPQNLPQKPQQKPSSDKEIVCIDID